VHGTAIEDPGRRLPRIAGIPTNLLGAGATTLTATVVGTWIGGRADRPAQEERGVAGGVSAQNGCAGRTSVGRSR
jgi:hypothetical protein